VSEVVETLDKVRNTDQAHPSDKVRRFIEGQSYTSTNAGHTTNETKFICNLRF